MSYLNIIAFGVSIPTSVPKNETIQVVFLHTLRATSYRDIFLFTFAADPGVYITEEMQYAAQGSNVTITAIISSSNLNTTSVEWYHEGTLINTTNDNRYSLSIDIVNSRSVLNIMNVDTDILGGYTIIVNGDGRSENDSVQLVFPGKYGLLIMETKTL